MTEIRTLAPHDPLPNGHSVVLMRRPAEDAPDRASIEMIVTNPDRSEETTTPVGEDGAPLDWIEAIGVAKRRAVEEGLKRIWTVDRTAGARLDRDHLDDNDLEHGEPGADMRDIDVNAAPRRFI